MGANGPHYNKNYLNEISNKGGDSMKFPGDKRTTSELIKDINTTLQRCGIDKKLIIVKK